MARLGIELVPPGPSGKPARPGGRKAKHRSAVALGLVPVFSDLSSRQLRKIAEISEEVPYQQGAIVVQEGVPGEAAFIVLEGEAHVRRGKRLVARLRPGDVFGEISVLDGGPRTASVVAETPLVVLRLHRRHLMRLMQKEPQIAVRLLAEVARRLRRAERTGSY